MKLLSPIDVGPLTLKNRVIMPAMHLGYTPDSLVGDRLISFYERRAAGGVALIVVGGCMIDDFSGLHDGLSLADDRFVPGLRRLTEAVHRNGALIAMQLYAAGRYAFSASIGGKQALAPSPIRSKFTGETPREITIEEIRRVIDAFAAATRRARMAGFDAVEILASAGYLIAQFLSPITNYRTDAYGGTLENRMRFGLEVAEAVDGAAGPDMAVLARIAGHDFMPGSHTNAEAAQFAAALAGKGVDALDVTGGWHETRVPQIPMNVPRGAYAYLAQHIKQNVNVPVAACNRINDPALAETILQQGRADLIGVARGHLADPDWVRKASANRSHDIVHCIGCNQGCFDHVFTKQPVNCLVNPLAGFEHEIEMQPAESPKRIMVVGGGPAGLTFAAAAARRGHQVRLFERESRLGGQLLLAGVLPERSEFLTMIRDSEAQARAAGVEILLGLDVDPDLVREENPDLVAIASGGNPVPGHIPGSDLPHVVQAWDVLAGRAGLGSSVAVIGGGAVGAETALYAAAIGVLSPEEVRFLLLNEAESPETIYRLAARGFKEVTLIEMTGRVGSDIGATTGWIVRQDLSRAGIKVMTKAKAVEITGAGVRVMKNDALSSVPADTVVLALGACSERNLYDRLAAQNLNVILVGDAAVPGKAYDAVHQAFAAALKI